MISKCHQNNSPVVCGGFVKYGEVEVDRLVAILKTNTCGGGGGSGGPRGMLNVRLLPSNCNFDAFRVLSR